MAITYKYTINSLETAPSAYSKTDVITRIRFDLSGSEGTGDSKKEANFSGCCAMPALKEGDTYVEFKDLTEAKIIEWVKEYHGEDHPKEVISKKIDDLKVPMYVEKDAPWA
jgi:hypothetical protein